MPRAARLDSPGTLHHVIIRGIERGRIVDDDHDRENFVERLKQQSLERHTPIYAWALMTNHAHMLLRSGPEGLSAFMRKFLTGYAVYYNHRHRRHGHLFQNRYKSIVCEEDPYFKELLRYIHLNPLRAKIVDSMAKLDWYRWSGHSCVVGRRENTWYARDYVLKWFGSDEKRAIHQYREFVKKGIPMGSQSHLVGGGLIRSAGGWSEVKALRRIGDRQASDSRILGRGEFVEQMTDQETLERKYRLLATDRLKKAEALIASKCGERAVPIGALKGGSRTKTVSAVRRSLYAELVQGCGLTMAESARLLGVSTSAISNAIKRERR